MMSYKVARERQEDCFLFVKSNSQIVKLNLQIINLRFVKRGGKNSLGAIYLTDNTIIISFLPTVCDNDSESVRHDSAQKRDEKPKKKKNRKVRPPALLIYLYDW